MTLRVGGLCKTGRHLLAAGDFGPSGCIPCHRENVARYRGGYRNLCTVCDRPAKGLDRRGLCPACRPEIAFLTALYRVIAHGGRPLMETCPLGHPYDVANTRVILHHKPRPWVARHCRACTAAALRRHRRLVKLRLIRSLLLDQVAA